MESPPLIGIMRRVFTLSFWKKATAFCFALVIVSVMLSGFQQPAQAAVPANCGVYKVSTPGGVGFTGTSLSVTSGIRNSFTPNLPSNASSILRLSTQGAHLSDGYYWLDKGTSDTGAEQGDFVVYRCGKVSIVTTFAEPVWARYGEALIFLAGLITGVAIFWLLVGKVLKVLRLRRP